MKEKVIKIAITGAPFLGVGMLVGVFIMGRRHKKYVEETNREWKNIYNYTKDLTAELEEEIRRNRVFEIKVKKLEEENNHEEKS